MTLSLALLLIITLMAPLLAGITRRFGFLRAALDGFVLMTVVGLVVLVLVPDALIHQGEIAFFMILAGFLLPAVAEFIAHKRGRSKENCQKVQQKTHKVVLLISAFAIILHGMADGALLSLSKSMQTSDFLSTGIIAHRVGIALTLWWLLKPYIPDWGSYLILALFSVMTYAGFAMADQMTPLVEASLAGYWQAFAAGSLLHVVLHPLRERNIPVLTILRGHRAGTLVALVFIVTSIYSTVELSHPANIQNPDSTMVDHHHHQGMEDPHDDEPHKTNGGHDHAAHYHGGHIAQSAHGAHGAHGAMDESLYFMQMTGILLSPWLLSGILIGALFLVRKNRSFPAFMQAVGRLVPLTVAFWLLASLVYAYSDQHTHHDHLLVYDLNITLLFNGWLAIVALSLLVKGAPRFFSSLLPDILAHSHDH